MSLYLGDNLIAPNQSNAANKSLSNLDSTGQAVLSAKANTDLSNALPQAAFSTSLNNAGIRTIKETYVNGNYWYRLWSDNWLEQGYFGTTVQADTTFNLLKPYNGMSYTLVLGGSNANMYYVNKIGTSFYFAANAAGYKEWYACGYAA